MLNVPIVGVYPFSDPGHGITIHDGPMRVDSFDGTGRIWLSIDGDLDVRWALDGTDGTPREWVDLGPRTVALTRPGLGAVEFVAQLNDSDGAGHLAEVNVESGAPLSRVIAHWMNLPWLMPAEPLEQLDRGWAGRWSFSAEGWAFTLDARPDLNNVHRLQAGTRRFAMTHVSELRRLTGTFSCEEARNVMYAIQVAMSFALGRWVTPALPVGLDESGEVAWEQWTPWRGDYMEAGTGWWDTHTAKDLGAFMAAFLRAWLDPTSHDEVRLFAHHVVAANQPATTTEARVMLVHAAIEYMSWTNYVIHGSTSRRSYGKESAASHLRRLLTDARIPTGIPAELPAMFALRSAAIKDGPDAVMWVRNRIVHPKDAGEPYRIRNLLFEVWLLSMQYAELLLLERLDYEGPFVPRFPPDRFAHSREPVPWVQ